MKYLVLIDSYITIFDAHMYYSLLVFLILLYFLLNLNAGVKLFLTDSKGTKSSKNKKKNQRKKDQLKDTCPIESIKTDKQVWWLLYYFFHLLLWSSLNLEHMLR